MRKHILLVQPNYYSRYPPLGLLKLSTYHKKRGNTTEFIVGEKRAEKTPDEIYVTSLFTYAWKAVHKSVKYYKRTYPQAKVTLGGIYATLMADHAKLSGADHIHKGIFKEAESLMPDYEMAKKWDPEWDSSIIFTSRGCIRKCPFCAVPEMEGYLNSVRKSIRGLIYPGHKRVVIWDNNFLAHKHCTEIMKEIVDLGLSVDFNQGLDGRLMDEKKVKLLSQMKATRIRIAYDETYVRNEIKRAIDLLKVNGINGRNIVVYTLYNHKDTPEDFLGRVKDLMHWGVCSYPMRFEPITSLSKNSYVAPAWTPEKLEMVATARRVLGYGGAFPPYKGLVDKLDMAESFEKAFELRPLRTGTASRLLHSEAVTGGHKEHMIPQNHTERDLSEHRFRNLS